MAAAGGRNRAYVTVKLSANVSLEDVVKAMLGTKPPPGGDPSTRKAKPKKKPVPKKTR